MTDHEIPGPGPTPAPRSGGGRGLLIVGAILLIVGVITAISTFGRETPGSNDAAEFAAWNAGFTIGSAILIGVGLLLLALALVRRRRSAEARRAD